MLRLSSGFIVIEQLAYIKDESSWMLCKPGAAAQYAKKTRERVYHYTR